MRQLIGEAKRTVAPEPDSLVFLYPSAFDQCVCRKCEGIMHSWFPVGEVNTRTEPTPGLTSSLFSLDKQSKQVFP